LENSPLESSRVVVALTENYSTSKTLNISPEISLILSCVTVVVNGRYLLHVLYKRMSEGHKAFRIGEQNTRIEEELFLPNLIP
jgi:hypothetical protein